MQMAGDGARLHQIVPVEAVLLYVLDLVAQAAIQVREQLRDEALVAIQADELLGALYEIGAAVELDETLDR